MGKAFDPGKLLNARQVGDGYYFLVEGENEAGQTFSFVTRGKEKQNAATRIPFRLNPKNPRDLPRILEAARVSHDRLPGLEGRPEWPDYLQALEDLQLNPLESLQLLYMVMPRYGNVVSGLEVNAPGGTANLGETRSQVADREFEEEADLSVLCIYQPFPLWMQFASGCYDEIQHLDFALVTGDPSKLVEGAIRWGSVPLNEFSRWVYAQNDPDNSAGWETDGFVPMDGKVVMGTMFFIELIRANFRN